MSNNLMQRLSSLVRKWKEAGTIGSGGASATSDERRAGRTESYRECARQLSMVLASQSTEASESGVMVVPVELIDAVRSVVEAHREECESGSAVDLSQRLEHLSAVFSRLQQNGGAAITKRRSFSQIKKAFANVDLSSRGSDEEYARVTAQEMTSGSASPKQRRYRTEVMNDAEMARGPGAERNSREAN